MDVLGQALFLPEKSGHSLSFEFVHWMLQDVVNRFQIGKVNVEEKKEWNK
jgi:hypothetical protein